MRRDVSPPESEFPSTASLDDVVSLLGPRTKALPIPSLLFYFCYIIPLELGIFISYILASYIMLVLVGPQ